MSRMQSFRFVFFFALALALGPACQSEQKTNEGSQTAQTTAAGAITVKGSDTMVLLAQRWAETYMASRRDGSSRWPGGVRAPGSPRS